MFLFQASVHIPSMVVYSKNERTAVDYEEAMHQSPYASLIKLDQPMHLYCTPFLSWFRKSPICKSRLLSLYLDPAPDPPESH